MRNRFGAVRPTFAAPQTKKSTPFSLLPDIDGLRDFGCSAAQPSR